MIVESRRSRLRARAQLLLPVVPATNAVHIDPGDLRHCPQTPSPFHEKAFGCQVRSASNGRTAMSASELEAMRQRRGRDAGR
jgi:hypothetical protein